VQPVQSTIKWVPEALCPGCTELWTYRTENSLEAKSLKMFGALFPRTQILPIDVIKRGGKRYFSHLYLDVACSSIFLRTSYKMAKNDPLHLAQVTPRFVNHGPFFIFRLFYLYNLTDAFCRPKRTVKLSSAEGNKYWPVNIVSPRTIDIFQNERYQSFRLSDFLY